VGSQEPEKEESLNVKIRMLAGAAVAALTVVAMPANAVTSPELLGNAVVRAPDNSVGTFYASRNGAALWSPAAATVLIATLERASLDGMPSGPAIAAQARALMARANAGDAAARGEADRLLSSAWVQYVEALRTPPAGMTYADQWVAPRTLSARTILAQAAAAPSLAAHVQQVSAVNPLYARLRDAAWSAAQANGGQVDPRILASLDRVRDVPPQGRYVMVDTGGAHLYMIEDGRIVDSMKVIVGKADPTTQTPMIASTIYYATLNPYWHVSGDILRSTIAPNVLAMGTGYLKSRGYQVLDANDPDTQLDPKTVDWRAVAAGRETVRVRQLPGPANSMGQIKIPFPNGSDLYLHDTPKKDLFASDDRNLSHGCIRLEDAQRLGRWLMGRDPKAESRDPEQNVLLPAPVPIYLTYLTAQVNGDQISFIDDVYGRDRQVAALR
jgi:murein L,D-transpeptidase YcbB/YkuD